MKEYSTSEYEVKIGDPVVDAEVKATSTSVAIPCAAIPDGEYLISFEINGTAVAHRDTFTFASGSCAVGAYTLSYSSYALTVSGTSNNDIVRVMIEPLEVKTTDAFRAAVKKDAPKSEGGSGGGVLVVTDTDGTLDKTWQEIHDAMLSGGAVIQYGEAPAPNGVKVISDCMELPGIGYALTAGNAGDGYKASSASGYPALDE